MYLFIPSAAAAAAAAALYVSATVRHRVPDEKNYVGSLNPIPSSVLFLFIQTRFIFKVCTPWQYARIAASICLDYILGCYGYARSQGGR